MKPGLLRSEETNPEVVLAAASQEGIPALLLDGTGVVTKSAFLALAGRVLGAGDDFGLNLDALYDVLRDAELPLVLIWDGWWELAAADPRGFDGVLEVLAASGEDHLAADPQAALSVVLLAPPTRG